MNPDNERYLYDQIRDRSGGGVCIAEIIIDEMVASGRINHWKQGLRTLEKWVDKGWWDCGIRTMCGWLEEPELTYDERLEKGVYRWREHLE